MSWKKTYLKRMSKKTKTKMDMAHNQFPHMVCDRRRRHLLRPQNSKRKMKSKKTKNWCPH